MSDTSFSGSLPNLFEEPAGDTQAETICKEFIKWFNETPRPMRRYVLSTLGPTGVLRQVRDKIIKQQRGIQGRISIPISPIGSTSTTQRERYTTSDIPMSLEETPLAERSAKRPRPDRED